VSKRAGLSTIAERPSNHIQPLFTIVMRRPSERLSCEQPNGCGCVVVTVGGAMDLFDKMEHHNDYLAWLMNHRDGYVLNIKQPRRAAYLMLHPVSCYKINGTPTNGSSWTKGSIKACSINETELDDWAIKIAGAQPHRSGCCYRQAAGMTQNYSLGQ
jgi:hypothetical protein